MEVGLGPGHIALNGDPAPLKKETQTPPFSAHVCCGQTAGMIKMPLGTDSGLGPGDIMLDRDPASPAQKRGTAVPQLFGPCLLWLKGWMDQDVIWYGGRPWPKPHCSRWGPSSPSPQKCVSKMPMSILILAKRSPTSATAELLFDCAASLSESHV